MAESPEDERPPASSNQHTPPETRSAGARVSHNVPDLKEQIDFHRAGDERTSRESEEHDRTRAHTREWIGIGVTFIIGVAALVTSVWQGYLARESIEIARAEQKRSIAASKAAEEAAKIAERPYIAVTAYSPATRRPSGFFPFDVYVKGQSPAFNFTISAGCRVARLADGVDYGGVTRKLLKPRNTHIPGWQSSYLCPIEGYRQPHDIVVLAGRIEYDDRFGQQHYRNFCFVEHRAAHPEPLECPVLNDGD